MIPKRYDSFIKRDLTNVERMGDTLSTIEFMYRALDTLKFRVSHVANDLTDEQLEKIEEAVNVAYDAVTNAEFLGDYGYEPRNVYPVAWDFKK